MPSKFVGTTYSSHHLGLDLHSFGFPYFDYSGCFIAACCQIAVDLVRFECSASCGCTRSATFKALVLIISFGSSSSTSFLRIH